MRGDLVIGLDSSTTATKAIAFDRRGRTVAEGRAPVPLSNPKPGWFEQEVSDWTGAATSALRQLTRKVDAGRIAGLAISNQRESFAQFDDKDRPLRPGTLWLDERAQAEVADIVSELGDRVHQISGKPPDVTPCLYRCRWLSTHMPKLWRKTAKTAEVHGVLTHYLTGRWATSTASADPMGLLDLAAMDWSDKWLKAARLTRQQLPELFRPGDIMGEVSAQAARLTGLKAGTPVIAGGGDGQCAGAGANSFLEGRAYVNLGTAAVSGSYGRDFAIDRSFRTLVAVAEDGFSFETAIRTGTFLVNWMVERLFNVNPAKNPAIFKALEAEAKASPIGAHGLVLVPYWSGSMTPYWDSAARGVIAGMSGNHRRGDVYRALLEGVALEQAMTTNQVAAATSPITHFAAVGGGSRSDLWCQILADAAGRDVKRLETAEASALGAAMAAARGAGWYGSVAEAARGMSGKPSKTFRPRSKDARRYAELLAIYEELWPKLSGWNRRLVAFSASAGK
ncbi:MAG: FGGY-family carbohydrate kinase [Aestuariivirga sp.]|uniref:xylulokinase n=1 Tax=Aestuariivirga sp. TaxID=2650926 RepID=UPI0038D109FF